MLADNILPNLNQQLMQDPLRIFRVLMKYLVLSIIPLFNRHIHIPNMTGPSLYNAILLYMDVTGVEMHSF
jgi:hypothetical protein